MSEHEHFEGQWKYSGHCVYFPNAAGGFSLRDCPEPVDTAKRIAVCVNYCVGIDTTDLESAVTLASLRRELLIARSNADKWREEVVNVKRQKDELLASISSLLTEALCAVADIKKSDDAPDWHTCEAIAHDATETLENIRDILNNNHKTNRFSIDQMGLHPYTVFYMHPDGRLNSTPVRAENSEEALLAAALDIRSSSKDDPLLIASVPGVNLYEDGSKHGNGAPGPTAVPCSQYIETHYSYI